MRNMLKTLTLISVGLVAALLAGCERPPIEAVQNGYRGTGQEQISNPRSTAVKVALNVAPASLDAASPEGPKAGAIYQNVKILGDLSVAQFSRTMASITQWVAPKEGCTYCHNAANFAEDSKYTKVVARRMIQMTQRVNSGWKQHVAETGVTCYTCHRGNNIPANVWFAPKDRKYENGLLGDLAGRGLAAPSAGLTSLPFDPYTPFLKDSAEIRVNGKEALAATGADANRSSLNQTDHTYSLMVHMSESLGVNCTYCHNTRSFQSWEQSRPQRATAWYGIRMARELNNDYLVPLTDTFPDYRHGPKGDVAKVNCKTCHQGVFKPLYGAQMAKDFPELQVLAKQ